MERPNFLCSTFKDGSWIWEVIRSKTVDLCVAMSHVSALESTPPPINIWADFLMENL